MARATGASQVEQAASGSEPDATTGPGRDEREGSRGALPGVVEDAKTTVGCWSDDAHPEEDEHGDRTHTGEGAASAARLGSRSGIVWTGDMEREIEVTPVI